jgi:protein TonB
MKTIILILIATLFSLNVKDSAAQEKKKGNVYYTADEMPVYPGGEAALRNFLVKNINYPEKAKKEGKTGKVYVEFVVNKKGKVTDAKVAKGVCPELDAEALRVISLLDKWTPGKKKGKPVKVAFTLPIQFALS